jgi:hypothetical protein
MQDDGLPETGASDETALTQAGKRVAEGEEDSAGGNGCCDHGAGENNPTLPKRVGNHRRQD